MVVICITRSYLAKASGKGPKGHDENIRFEFNVSCQKKGVTLMVPVVFEGGLHNLADWPGNVSGKIGDRLRYDLSTDEPQEFEREVGKIAKEIKRLLRCSVRWPRGAAPEPPPSSEVPELQSEFPDSGTLRVQWDGTHRELQLIQDGHGKPLEVAKGMFGPIIHARVNGHEGFVVKMVNKNHVADGTLWRDPDTGQAADLEAKELESMEHGNLRVDDPYNEIRFLKELSAFGNSNVVRLHLAFSTPSWYYQVLEYGGPELLEQCNWMLSPSSMPPNRRGALLKPRFRCASFAYPVVDWPLLWQARTSTWTSISARAFLSKSYSA